MAYRPGGLIDLLRGKKYTSPQKYWQDQTRLGVDLQSYDGDGYGQRLYQQDQDRAREYQESTVAKRNNRYHFMQGFTRPNYDGILDAG